ncbi:MAG: peptidoglycan-binding protein, partial [Oscillospiraceae bacterium]|nr:peptidoglycan-binding protein [Oscillospiraceae bacterium]
MQTGYLKVEITSAYQAIPVAGAVVTLSLRDGTVFYRVTDASGQTERIAVPCPDAELSLDEYYEGEVYALCDVTVSADRFAPLTILGVQVFAAQEAILPITMQPNAIGSSFAYMNRGATYRIPATTLNDRTGTGQDPGAPQVLPRVVVPDYITVHLGRPTAWAQNVTETFANYIKNVCSSEIYPTWPETAIRANIYCQVSLALNRIFTEWYPSRGYDFDITNSTQFDQYYVKGRNIYTNISRLVDELFDNYIRRENFVEPLFSSYCNGTTATCSGLSQWGSENLASRGFTPYQILTYYYGNDIVIDQAPQAAGAIASWPGYALRRGDRGENVRVIQQQLLRIRRNYPLIPDLGTADGIFGARTEEAVRVFQSIFNLAQDGVVGKATWYKISYIYVAVTQIAELTSEGITQTPTIPATRPTTVLRRGSSGSDVRLAQFLLNLASAFYGGNSPIVVDGSFGPATEAAVREFQANRSITVDGVIGGVTWGNLLNVYYSVQNTITGSNPAYPGTPLRVGSSGSSVQLVQRYLNVIASFYSGITPVAIDGRFGNATAASVRQFQSMFGISADGVVGPVTWNRLVSVYNSLTGIVTTNVPFGGVLRYGMSSEDVRELQRYLAVIHSAEKSLCYPETHGRYGENTRAAVRALQQQGSLPITGEVDERTWKELLRRYDLALGRTPQQNEPCPPVCCLLQPMQAEAQESGQAEESSLPLPEQAVQSEAENETEEENMCSKQQEENLTYAAATAETAYSKTLRRGSSGPEVVRLQRELNEVAWTYPSIGQLNADGKFGAKTEAAVAQFQRIFGLSDDGVAGSRTFARLSQKLADVRSRRPATETPVYPGTALRRLRRSEWVRMVQRYLNRVAA